MGAAENAAMVRRLFEDGVNGADDSAFDEVLSPDYVNYDMPAPGPGPDGMKAVMGMFRSGFPDMHVELHDVVADDERVATRGVFTGTHQGEFMGVPASGKPIEVNYIDMWRVRDGKLAENWVRLDMATLMEQIGAA
jgi:steroid delta-isomerase-like uncharacterized protein